MATGIALAWWFTPRPEMVVPLTEGAEYGFVEQHAHWRSKQLAMETDWAPIIQVMPNYAGLRDVFLNFRTGEIREWEHPGRPLFKVIGFDRSGRFLLHDALPLVTNGGQRWNPIRDVHWFQPETGDTGTISVPAIAPDDVLVDLDFTPLVSADARRVVHVVQDGSLGLRIHVYDLETGAAKTVHTEQQVSGSFVASASAVAAISPDGQQLVVRNLRDPRAGLPVFDTNTGEVIEVLPVGSVGPLHWSNPWAWANLDSSGEHYLSWNQQTGFTVRSIAGDQLAEFPAKREQYSVTNGWDSYDTVAQWNSPVFVPGTNGLVAVRPTHGTSGSQWLKSAAEWVGITLMQEGTRDFVYWYDWKWDELSPFRSSGPESMVSPTLAVRPNRVLLLIDSGKPTARVEIWKAPPVRPWLAIWMVSIAVGFVCWFTLRRRRAARLKHQPETDPKQ